MCGCAQRYINSTRMFWQRSGWVFVRRGGNGVMIGTRGWVLPLSSTLQAVLYCTQYVKACFSVIIAIF